MPLKKSLFFIQPLVVVLCVLAHSSFAQGTENKQIETLFTKIDSSFLAGNKEKYKTLLWKVYALAKDEYDTLNLLKANRKLFKYYVLDRYNEDSLTHYYLQSKRILTTFKNKEYKAYHNYLYAEYLTNKGDYKEAYGVFTDVERTIKNKEYSFLPFFYSAFAKLHYRLGETDLAFEKLKLTGATFKSQNDLINTSVNYNNLGVLYKNQQQFDSSLVYYKKAMKISQQLKDTIGIAYALNNIGSVYFEKNELSAAENYFKKAFKKTPNSPSKSLLNNYSKTLIGIGNYTKAESILRGVINDVIEPQIKIEALQNLVILKKIEKKYAQALGLQDSLLLEKEKLLNTTKVEEIERLKAAYNSEKKNQEIQLLTQQKERQFLINKQNRNLGFVILVVVFLIFIILGLSIRNKIISQHANQLLLEQQLLRSQMNPHFIFNALSNIQSTILQNDTKKAVSYLAKFSKLVRTILENSKDTKITVVKEVEAIQNYLDLQKIRFSNHFNYTITLDEAIEDELTYIPSMLFQPLVENAIEHGIESIENGQIDIHFTLHDKHIKCVVEDNGIGFSNTKNVSNGLKKSMSTQIIKDRLTIFSKRIKQPLQCKVSDKLKDDKIVGTLASIDIPILNH